MDSSLYFLMASFLMKAYCFFQFMSSSFVGVPGFFQLSKSVSNILENSGALTFLSCFLLLVVVQGFYFHGQYCGILLCFFLWISLHFYFCFYS